MGWNSMQEQVHIFKYGGKEIPVTYDFENIQDRLQECNCVIDLFLDYLKEKNIVFTEEEKKLLIADESIATSYIEGYETWLIPYFLVQECKCKGLAEHATISCYNSYLYSLEKYKGENINDIDSILDIWKKLVSYKRLFIKRIRKSGVRVGNRMVTTHVAPPAKYVKSLLGDMFDSLQRYSKKSEDKYGLISPILFHYLYTFIHPFLDGNGRSARMIEQIMIKNTNNFDFVIPFSDIILEDRKAYYKTFKSGQTFGDGPTDVLSINLDDFINYNLYTIEKGFIILLSVIERKIEFTDLDDIDFEGLFNDLIENKFGFFKISREKVKERLNDNIIYCKCLLSGKFKEKDGKIEIFSVLNNDILSSINVKEMI